MPIMMERRRLHHDDDGEANDDVRRHDAAEHININNININDDDDNNNYETIITETLRILVLMPLLQPPPWWWRDLLRCRVLLLLISMPWWWLVFRSSRAGRTRETRFTPTESWMCRDPFGNTTNDTWPANNPQGFCTGTFDLSTDARVVQCVYLRGNLVASSDLVYVPWRLRVLAGNLTVEDNSLFQNLVEFDELAIITGNLKLVNNTNLRKIAGFSKLQCIGGRFILKDLPNLYDMSDAFQSLSVVADSIQGPPTDEIAFEISKTAIKDLLNFYSLMRVGAQLSLPFEILTDDYNPLAWRGQRMVIVDNPFLTTLDGLQNLYLIALPGDNNAKGSDFGGLIGDFGPCGFLSTESLKEGLPVGVAPLEPPNLVIFQRNRTYGLCHYPTDFIDQGNAGTYTSYPTFTESNKGEGPCRPGIEVCTGSVRAINQGTWWWPPASNNYGFLIDGIGTFGNRNTNLMYRTCQVYQNGKPLYGLPPVPGLGGLAQSVLPQIRGNAYRSYVCAPTAMTILSNVVANQLGSYFELALASGLEDTLSSVASRVTVMAPTDYAIHRTFGGIGGMTFSVGGLLTANFDFARRVALYAVGFANQPLSGGGYKEARVREGAFGTEGFPKGGRLQPGLAIPTLDCALPDFACNRIFVFASKAADPVGPFSRMCNLVSRVVGDAELSLPGRAVGRGVQLKKCTDPPLLYGYAPWITNTTKGPDFAWVQREAHRDVNHSLPTAPPTAAWNADVSLPEYACANGVVYAVGELSEQALAPPRDGLRTQWLRGGAAAFP